MISKYCATEFKPKSIGYLYTLRNPFTMDIFYVGRTYDRKNRYTGHVSDAVRHSGTSKMTEKEKHIVSIIEAGSKPIMGYIEQFSIRTPYDKLIYYYKEFYWIRNYLEIGWDLKNLDTKGDYSEASLKNLLKKAKEGGELDPSHFYYGKDYKDFPIYDHKKMRELGYAFSKSEFASHWSYYLEIEKYQNIQESTHDYCYGDVISEGNKNKNYYLMFGDEIPDEVNGKRFY